MTSDSGISQLWTRSVKALAEVEAIRTRFNVHRTIWYFFPISDEDDDDLDLSSPFWSEVQRQATERFPDLVSNVIGFHCGVELLEKCAPTSDWLKTRLSQMEAFADATGLFLRGWAYEPEGHLAGNPPQAFVDDLKSELTRRVATRPNIS